MRACNAQVKEREDKMDKQFQYIHSQFTYTKNWRLKQYHAELWSDLKSVPNPMVWAIKHGGRSDTMCSQCHCTVRGSVKMSSMHPPKTCQCIWPDPRCLSTTNQSTCSNLTTKTAVYDVPRRNLSPITLWNLQKSLSLYSVLTTRKGKLCWGFLLLMVYLFKVVWSFWFTFKAYILCVGLVMFECD